jgi:hypothetical protein
MVNMLYGLAAVMLCLFTFAMSGFNVIPWWVAGILSTLIYLGMWAFKSEYARMIISLVRRRKSIVFVETLQNWFWS